jgi:hypothetical protein
VGCLAGRSDDLRGGSFANDRGGSVEANSISLKSLFSENEAWLLELPEMDSRDFFQKACLLELRVYFIIFYSKILSDTYQHL